MAALLVGASLVAAAGLVAAEQGGLPGPEPEVELPPADEVGASDGSREPGDTPSDAEGTGDRGPAEGEAGVGAEQPEAEEPVEAARVVDDCPEPDCPPPPPLPPPPPPMPTEEELERARLFARQLAEDPTEIPAGMGAIFVPALTDPTLEPAVDVFRDGTLVETSPVARKIFLPPGRYVVRAGLGNQRVRPFVQVDVAEGEVVTAVPTWAALIVDVVDERAIPHRGAYDLIRLDTRETVGSGRGADRRTGEGLRTWLLIPGTYKIVPPGGTYRERVDYVTVRIDPAEVTHFRLVMDRTTSAFRGGGVQVEDDEPTRVRGLELRGALGGSVELTHRHHVPESDDGAFLGGALFLDFDMHYDRGLSYFWLQLQVEAGARFDFRDDWRKSLDFIDFAAIYILQVHRLVGPYARISYDTHMMPVHAHFDSPTEVVLSSPSGEEERRIEDATRVALGPVFALHDLRQGVGLNARPVRSYWINLDLRLGLGFQQLLTRDLYVAQDDPSTEAREFQRLERFTRREGVELGLVALGNLTGWLSYILEFGILEPFLDLENPILELELMLTLRLWSFASLNYLLRLRRDTAISADPQIGQAVLLRFAWDFL